MNQVSAFYDSQKEPRQIDKGARVASQYKDVNVVGRPQKAEAIAARRTASSKPPATQSPLSTTMTPIRKKGIK